MECYMQGPHRVRCTAGLLAAARTHGLAGVRLELDDDIGGQHWRLQACHLDRRLPAAAPGHAWPCHSGAAATNVDSLDKQVLLRRGRGLGSAGTQKTGPTDQVPRVAMGAWSCTAEIYSSAIRHS